jgi:hypothetical protein
MPYNFPDAPTFGTIVAGPGNIRWQWDGRKWLNISAATAGGGGGSGGGIPEPPRDGLDYVRRFNTWSRVDNNLPVDGGIW